MLQSLNYKGLIMLRSLRYTLVPLLIIILAGNRISAQEQSNLLDAKTRDLLHEALSGEIAKEHVIQITRHHRIQGSRGYRDAANYVLGQLRRYGFSEKDAYIESFKSDGKIQYQTWQSPSGWDISSGELRMTEPYEERIVGYPEIAMSVITYSNPGDVTAELVWVGSGTKESDYTGKDVRGKFVLATGYGGSVHRLAVLKYGAKAVVCYLDDDRAKEYPDMLQYTGMWPRTEELSRVTFGFNLTNRQGEKLKGLLQQGKKVVLHGAVKGIGLEPYWMDVVVAHIRGSEKGDEELVFSAHLDHPKESANDNASGSGAILDIARTLKELTGTGRLPKPKRSFRFIWIPEFYGTMAYIDKHPELTGKELGGKFLANINMDMVGENPDLLHSVLLVTRTPSSIPSCLNDVVENMIGMVDNIEVSTPRGSLSAFNFRITPYSGGSDHMMFIDRKIPGMMFSHSDYTHHTSEDTPDKVDPAELERCEIISTSAMWYLANLSPAQAAELAYLCGANALRRRGLTVLRLHSMFSAASQDSLPHVWSEAQSILNQSLEAELAGIASVLNFSNDEKVRGIVEWIHGNFKRQHEAVTGRMKSLAQQRGVAAEAAPPTESDQRIPVRTTRGPVDFEYLTSKLDPAREAWYDSINSLGENMRFEAVNFIDGKRNVGEIRNAISAEFQPVPLADVRRFLEDLITVGALKWK